jgi:hypothetical protein
MLISSWRLTVSWMFRPIIPAVFFALLLSGSGGHGADKDQAEHVAALIKQLGSPKYAERQASGQALDRLGPAALPALNRAAKSVDPEVSRHARALVRRINKRVERDRLLAAKRVHLIYRDTPLMDAVADFGKKTGFVIQIEGDRSKLAGRKITLDTGKTTFWQAFDLFCVRAHLVERGLSLAQTKNLTIGPNPGKTDPRLRLLYAKPLELPTCYFHGVRVRALPSSIPLEEIPKAEGERVLVLEASLEPRIRLRNLVGLCVEKATDEHGKRTGASASLLNDGANSNYVASYMRNPMSSHAQRLMTGMNEGNFRRVLVKVQGAKKLHELQGIVFIEVDKPAGVIGTVKDILKVSNKTVDLPEGGSLLVSQARRQANGQVEVKVQSTFPLGGVNGIRIMNNIVMVRRQFGGEWETVGVNPAQIKLLDRKGKAFHLTSTPASGCSFAGGGITQNMTLVYEPVNGQESAAQLVFIGVGTAVVEVPFVLKNVALPEK